jgi:tRNA (adenine57-N1/adenine58-N1)-methyltransferase catalytic subunit
VQITDPRGKPSTITLKAEGSFQTHRGYFRHSELIGASEGTIVETSSGVPYLALRPLLLDHVLSMPRGAAVIYPKDSAQIVSMADVYPGARVVEAGVGSGALTMSLLRAVGDGGSLLSIERREDFAAIATGNVEAFFGASHPAWELAVGDLADVLPTARENGTVDRIVLDMLAPWENIDVSADALAPGGVLLAYVATTTQLSRFAEDLKADGRFTEPLASETMLREWHLEGLAVRPSHRMVAHTGFLVTTRRMADGVEAPLRRRRPAKSTQSEDAEAQEALARDAARVQIGQDWTPEDFGERGVTAKKARRAGRHAEAIRDGAVSGGGATDPVSDSGGDVSDVSTDSTDDSSTDVTEEQP